MKNRFLLLLAVVCAILLSGCATPNKMALANDGERATESAQPILLMTATLKNTYKTSFQPMLSVVFVEKPGAQQASDRLNFTMDDRGRLETGDVATGNTYLLRMAVPPGEYELVGFSSFARSFPFVGYYFTPMHAHLKIDGPGVYYLGHIDASVRERQGEEFRAGSVVPLLDQSVAGASSGTFDVVISDHYVADELLFRARFPALAGAAIRPAVLPPFNRAAAQQWWETH
jgi:hypothetical protein